MKQKTLMEETMTMNKTILLLGVLLLTSGIYAEGLADSDLDGVPDSKDACPNTPFLNEVNSKGCTVRILLLPEEQLETDTLTLSLGYGYSTNEDLLSREIQRNTNFELNYYKNVWSYALHTGYYSHNLHDGMLDTTVKVKRMFKMSTQHLFSLGAGLKFPTHRYTGNKTDVFLSSSIHAYPTPKLSYFAGYSFMRIGDDALPLELKIKKDDTENHEGTGLQNIHKFYVGAGYFFTERLHGSLRYNLEESKFKDEHNIVSFSASLYYKIDEKWFATLYYKRQIADEDLHDNLIFKVGYHLW